MNIVNPHGPVGIDEHEEGACTGGGLSQGRPGESLIHVEDQLARKVKAERHLREQVKRLVAAEASARIDEQNRRQEILRELSAEQTRRQEAEAEACKQRHRAAELSFLVDALEAEVEALSGLPRCTLRDPNPCVDTDFRPVQDIRWDLDKPERTPQADLNTTENVSQLTSEIKLLREQVLIHREDWDREHKEKETVQKLNDQLKAELERVKHELGTTRAKLGKAENEKEMLLLDSRLAKDSYKSKDWMKQDTTKDSYLYDDKLFSKLSGTRLVGNAFVKHRPQHTVNNPPDSYMKLESKLCEVSAPTASSTSERWACPQCTLINMADKVFCEVCGERRKQPQRPCHKTQNVPMSTWMEHDPHTSTAYR